MSHIPVLLNTFIEYLTPKEQNEGRVYVDCTFGMGGYTRKILNANINNSVIAIDCDPNVKQFADKFQEEFGKRFVFINDNFSNVVDIIKSLKKPFNLINGIVWDLGLSSMQIDCPKRGFSFMRDASLDMRMSEKGLTACEIINSARQQEIAQILHDYGDERFAKKIAHEICQQRIMSPIVTTRQLSTIVSKVIKIRTTKIDPATRTFQAIRIWTNNELENLKSSLANLSQILTKGARIVFVSFHSGEDKIIKDYLQCNSLKKISKSKYHEEVLIDSSKTYEILTKKPISASLEEIKNNPRSRSAKLRAAIKIC